MKNIVIILHFFAVITIQAQNTPAYWQIVTDKPTGAPLAADATYQILQLQLADIQLLVQQKTQVPIVLQLPLPDGNFVALQVEETPVMAPALAARYPAIRTFRASDATRTIRACLDVSPQGLHAMIEQAGRLIYVDPFENQANKYISYYAEEASALAPLHCATLPSAQELPFAAQETVQNREGSTDLRTYRLAVACTGEFTQRFGGTLEGALAIVVSAVNRLNHIYTRELGVRFQLISQTDRLLFTDPLTDPFPSTDKVVDILNQSPGIFQDSLQLSLQDYDLSHVLLVNCAGANGIADLSSVCRNSRAGTGVTCFTSADLEGVVTSIFAHEIAHQFSAAHTFDTECHPAQVALGTAVEPLCGHTIMSYNTTDKLPFFHTVSLEQQAQFIKIRASNGCGTPQSTNNRHTPKVIISYTQSMVIPMQTPFELTAAELTRDADGDLLTYAWEQVDDAAPLFRSYAPSASAKRTFPALPSLLNGENSPFEKLPTTNRTLNFRCTVRDNHPIAGATHWESWQVQATTSAGPFRVLYPNSDTVVWRAGEQASVRWDVAKTDQGAVNCQQVDIRLSLDGGYTYPVLLLQNAPNTGEATFFLPDVTSERARIRVEASFSVFFAITPQNFKILPSLTPSFIVEALPKTVYRHCTNQPLQFTVEVKTIQHFHEPLVLSLEGNLPPGTRYEWSSAQLTPPGQARLQLFFPLNGAGFFKLKLKATTPQGQQKTTEVQFELLPQQNTALTLVEPSPAQPYGYDGNFRWSYTGFNADFEIATSPAFDSTVILRLDNTAMFATLSNPVVLSPERLYFWRVRPIFPCSVGEWSVPGAFYNTYTTQCRSFTRPGYPKRLSPQEVEYEFRMAEIGTVNRIERVQLNLLIAGSDTLEALPKMSLTSPRGRKIYLSQTEDCLIPDTLFQIGFSESSDRPLSCEVMRPNRLAFFRPAESFDAFWGEPLSGQWRLQLAVATSLDSVNVTLFQPSIRWCRNFPAAPTVFQSDTLHLRAREHAALTPAELTVGNTLADALQTRYTLVTQPRHGELRYNGQPLLLGATFTQQDVHDRRMEYWSTQASATLDSFHLLAQDATGSLLPVRPFFVAIHQTPTPTHSVSVEPKMILFPNPAKDILNIKLESPLAAGALTLVLTNAQGHRIQQQLFAQGNTSLQLKVNHLASGMYFVTLHTAQGSITQKLIIE